MTNDGIDPYHYEAFSVSAALKNTLHEGGAKECQKKMKANTEKSHIFELDQAFGSESRVSLDLMKLSSEDTTQKSKMEFDFFDSENVPDSSVRAINNEGTNENTREDKTSEPKTYCCNFCKREFSSSQALGGHQNAHKQERDMMKKRPGIDVGILGHSHFPCYPIYGSYNRALRVRMDSMIQKPHSYDWIPPRYGHGGRWPSWQTVMNPSLIRDRRLMMELQAHNGGFGGVLGSFENPRVEDSTIPFLHLGNSLNSYVAESSGTVLNKPTSTSRRDHHVRPVEESTKVDDDHEFFGLDLTLKL